MFFAAFKKLNKFNNLAYLSKSYIANEIGAYSIHLDKVSHDLTQAFAFNQLVLLYFKMIFDLFVGTWRHLHSARRAS